MRPGGNRYGSDGHLAVVCLADGCAGFAAVAVQVCVAGVDVDGELAITAECGQVQSAPELPVGAVVAAGVVGHPSGHLDDSGRGDENLGRGVVAAEQSWGKAGVPVVQHGGMYRPIGLAEQAGMELDERRRVHGAPPAP